jgi:hypothetical protein
MRKLLGAFLLWTGLAVGTLVGLGILAGVKISNAPWFVAVGLVKITLVGAVGLMVAGATLQRLAKRDEARRQLSARADADR